MTPRRLLLLAFKVALVGGCVAYVLWGVDLRALGARLASYSTLDFAIAVGVSFVAYLFVGVRLVVLFEGRVALGPCFWAGILALGVNNILPARLGELAKVLFLQARGSAGPGRTLGVVFWERFLDLNALLLIAVPVLATLGQPIALWSLGAVVGGLWLAIGALRRWPGWSERLARRIPHASLARAALDLRESLRDGIDWLRLGLAALVTLLVWSAYAVQMAVCLEWVAALPIGIGGVLTVFVATAIGFAVPSSPGGLGVVEAAIVAALAWFGIGKEEALAAALVVRAVQYVPTTVGALGVIAASDLSLARLRAPAPPSA